MALQSTRIKLREFEQFDFPDLAEMLQDPRVMYAYEHVFSDRDVQEWLDRQQTCYFRYGFGLWAIVLRETGEMVGQAGLTMQPCEETEVLEIGYLLKRRFWHQGYATEAAEVCKQYAFSQLQAPKVYSIIKADNEPSKRVARAIGMQREKKFYAQYFAGRRLHELFSVSRPG